MTVAVLCSVKHAPGVTTSALALAAGWPGDRPVLLAECDAAGGDALCWYGHQAVGEGGLLAEPGLASLAVSGRRGVTPEMVLEHTQLLPGNGSVRALVAPVAGEQARAALSGLVMAGLAEALASIDGYDVIVDAGRMEVGSAAVELAARADTALLVARPTMAGVAHVQAVLAVLGTRIDFGLVLVGDRPYSASEVAQAVGVPVAAVLPVDPRCARALSGQGAGRAGSRRSALLEASRRLAGALASPPADGGPRPDPATGPRRVEEPTAEEWQASLVPDPRMSHGGAS